jgi:alkylation response protein AidB-like acyl-CoA dehydrogenase
LRTWLDRLIADAAGLQRDGAPVLADEGAQAALAGALIQIEVLRHHATRTMSAFLNGGAVGPESSTVKLLMAAAEQRLAASAIEIAGHQDEFWSETYLYSRAASVYGGTAQIQRNIIADRILGLPQE